MVSYIYLITNQINKKQYVGQTSYSLEQRWKQHIKDSKREICEIRPLYRAMRKYGEENFTIEQIEECDTQIVAEREQYWIQYYDTYDNGYNATLGGDGKILYDYDEIVKTYLSTHNASEVARTLNCHPDSVRKILKANDIPIIPAHDIIAKKYNKKIAQYDKKGNFIKVYNSAHEAARYLGSENYRRHIQECLRGKRKTAYGFIWCYE